MSKLQMYLDRKGASSALETIVGRIDDISTLPHVALRVMEVANDPKSGAADLKEAVEGDAAFSARVLRCVNSSAYGTRTQITNLQQAVAYLGLKQIRNLAMTASVSDLFKRDAKIGTYRRSGLWRHLVSVGLCARLIAMRRKVRHFEDVFVAGLLHDIGIVFEDQYAHGQFRSVIQSLDTRKTLAESEREQLDFDHTTLGERVADNWGFSERIKAAIRYHHTSADYEGEEIDVVRCIEVANVICTLKGISSVGLKLVEPSQAALEGLSLGREDLLVMDEDLDKEIDRNARLFHV